MRGKPDTRFYNYSVMNILKLGASTFVTKRHRPELSRRPSTMLRSMDTFAKPREDLRSRSALGGTITLLATGAAGLLFLAQVYLYISGSTRHSLQLSQSSPIALLPTNQQNKKRNGKGRIPLNIHITFPHVNCDDLDCAHDNAYLSTGKFQALHGHNALRKRIPTKRELEVFFNTPTKGFEGCTVQGVIDIPKVGGTFTTTVAHRAWRLATGTIKFAGPDGSPVEKMKLFNISHYVHSISFGEPFPLSQNPLENTAHVVENDAGGVGLASINVRLVPTRYKRFFSEQDTYQVSVTEHMVQPEYLVTQNTQILPGLALSYDFTPLTVHHVEYRDNFFVFLSSLVSIVGGVFVTVSLVTGCLFHSAAAVAKKKD